jgi:hypothetical protein
MINKSWLGFVTLLFIPFLGLDKPMLETEKCYDCDDELMYRAEKYLDSLKEHNAVNIKHIYNEVDSLGYVIVKKDKIISVQSKQINSLKMDLKEKPKEIIIRDTIIVETKKSFWGKTKIDTIKQ